MIPKGKGKASSAAIILFFFNNLLFVCKESILKASSENFEFSLEKNEYVIVLDSEFEKKLSFLFACKAETEKIFVGKRTKNKKIKKSFPVIITDCILIAKLNRLKLFLFLKTKTSINQFPKNKKGFLV